MWSCTASASAPVSTCVCSTDRPIATRRSSSEPFAFRVDRDPNWHIGFGIGEHVCLGAHLARLELQVLFRKLAERIDHIELAGPVERLQSSFISGIKHLPVRLTLRR